MKDLEILNMASNIEKDSPAATVLTHKSDTLYEDSPPQDRLSELLQLFTSWKIDQDIKLTELMKDVKELKEQTMLIQQSNVGVRETMDSIFNKNGEMKDEIEDMMKNNERNVEKVQRALEVLQLGSNEDGGPSTSNVERSPPADHFDNEQGAPMINYGVGMACSFFEGYLTHVIPSDGARFVGFQENINIFEASQGVVFPVKRLFIVITKSLYCPPDLKHFNKENRHDLAFLEAVKSLEDIEKDVAGVKNRTYRNSAYKIYRPGPTRKPPVFVCAEFATPLHTLHKVLEKRFIYDKLCDVDAEVIVKDFCDQLRKIIARSPDCRGKCELVHYDDTNPDENLADVLLNKIKEIEPKFDEIIEKKSREIK